MGATTQVFTIHQNSIIMERLTFKEVLNKLNYVYVEDTKDKSSNEVSDEIRKQIRNMGWDCLDETWDEDSDAKEWVEENHPELENCEWSSISENDFLCDNQGFGEHDVDWYTFHISFYGVWEKEGVFNVTT